MKLRKFLPLALSMALMLNFSACNKKGKTSSDEDLTKIVATVGDESISALELKFYLSMDKQEAESSAGLDDKSDEEKKKYWQTEEGEAKKLEIIDKTLESLKELKIMVASAKKDNISLDQMELDSIDQTIEQIIQIEGNGDKEEANKAMIRDYGISLDQYKTLFTEFVLAYNKYNQVKPAQIEISDSEIQKEFEENKEQFNKVTVKHILIQTVDPNTGVELSEDEVATKRALAEDILKRAQEGEDFEELVKQYSEDPGSKDSGGEYTFPKGKMVPEFEEWSFNAKEGDMGIVETTYGYHVMKFIEHLPPTLGDEEKASITATLQADEFIKMIDNLKAETQLKKNQEVIDSLDLF